MFDKRRGRRAAAAVALPAILALAVALAGCATPGAPLPPSLNLPAQVTDLAAERAGDQVTLTWTMPRRNTDKLLLKGFVAVHICRSENDGPCVAAGPDRTLAPGASASIVETLPDSLTEGARRVLRYTVDLKNRKGRSAGASNAAQVLAGQAPGLVEHLNAEVHRYGVVLTWRPAEAGVPVRLQRTLQNPPKAKPKESLLAPPPEPEQQNLLVADDMQQGRALDRSVHFGQTYIYRAQRVVRVTTGGLTLELAGPLSAPVRVDVADVFPPQAPRGLAAVAIAAEDGVAAAIDLNWQPDSDPDLAGYAVYRSEGSGAWQRISPAQPVVGPAFHDARVQPGQTYHYAVSAIDKGGHESARSAEATDTVPAN